MYAAFRGNKSAFRVRFKKTPAFAFRFCVSDAFRKMYAAYAAFRFCVSACVRNAAFAFAFRHDAKVGPPDDNHRVLPAMTLPVRTSSGTLPIKGGTPESYRADGQQYVFPQLG